MSGMFKNNKRAFQITALPQNSLSLHFLGSQFSKYSHPCYRSVSLTPHFSFMLFFICHASNLLHFSVQLSQIEQRLFLRVHQCVTLFLSVQVHVFNCPPVSVDLLSMISGRASDSLHVMFFTCAQ